MKRFTQIVCLILIIATILAIPAFAAEQASDFFMSHSCYIWNASDSKFEVWFDVTAVEMMDKLGVSEIKIQRSTNRSNWETVQTFGSILSSNTSFSSGHVTYSSRQPGYYYRAKVTFYAKNDNGIGEYISATSYI